MTKKIISDEIVEVSRDWTHGIRTYEDGTKIPYMKMNTSAYERNFWFLQPPQKIIDHYGWKISDQKINAMLSLFDDNIIDLIYYLYAAAINTPHIDLVVKLLIGPVAEWTSTKNIAFKSSVLMPNELREFISVVTEAEFISSKYKQAMIEYLDGATLDSIRNNKAFWQGDNDDLNAVVSKVISDNQDKIVSDNRDKMINWLTGQVMKATKGQADPVVVKSIIDKTI